MKRTPSFFSLPFLLKRDLNISAKFSEETELLHRSRDVNFSAKYSGEPEFVGKVT